MKQEALAVIVGPTAVGKSAVAVEVAERVNGEIISSDSMQVYRGMDIGTAKIKPVEMRGIPHHLLDIRDPDEEFSVADFQTLVRRLISEINARGRLPILVGGTGLYVRSVIDQYEFGPSTPEPAIRQRLRALAEKEGPLTLHRQLAKVDPLAAQKIHPHDLRRTIRALEVFELTGQSISATQYAAGRWESLYELAMVGLIMDRTKLYQRINERVETMLAEGLVDEVRRLLDQGYTAEHKALQGLGYKEIIGYLNGNYDLVTAVELIKRNTRRFAKRQLTWFRRDPRIVWFDVESFASLQDLADEITAMICRTIRISVE
ncbi:MAG: tRNA (adenosine(37)-N6)-dimethylallyltransferase MiaA [Firmicutes bacterium]|nr:tRNA (adenosine(37)-N6)-dimethylallyltransferase MiaA [Bacillota bacterium]